MASRRIWFHFRWDGFPDHFLGEAVRIFRLLGYCSNYQVQDNQGKQRDAWENLPIRITDVSAAPDGSRLVAVGISRAPITVSLDEPQQSIDGSVAPQAPSPIPIAQKFEKRIMVWSWAEKRVEAWVFPTNLSSSSASKLVCTQLDHFRRSW